MVGLKHYVWFTIVMQIEVANHNVWTLWKQIGHCIKIFVKAVANRDIFNFYDVLEHSINVF